MTDLRLGDPFDRLPLVVSFCLTLRLKAAAMVLKVYGLYVQHLFVLDLDSCYIPCDAWPTVSQQRLTWV